MQPVAFYKLSFLIYVPNQMLVREAQFEAVAE